VASSRGRGWDGRSRRARWRTATRAAHLARAVGAAPAAETAAVFADAHVRLAFEAPPPDAAPGARSPAVWADLGAARVRWARVP
jgi:hypothetical protein